MPLFSLHRNFVMRTTKGHAIAFVKDKAVMVPDTCVHDAIAIGARQVDGKKVDNLGEEKKKVIPMSPQERKDKVFEAFRTMKAREERLDFTGNGLPNAKRMPALLGFEISPRERDDYWQEFRESENEAKAQAVVDAKVEAES